jgi:hypothetical protein
VAEQRATKIRVFDSGGTFVKALGREGDGPGEFRDIQALAVSPDDEVVVYDRTHRRLTRFPPVGDDPSPSPSEDEPETFRVSAEYPLIHSLPDGKFVLLVQPRRQLYSPQKPRLHVLNNGFEKVGDFGVPSDWGVAEDEFSQVIVRTPFVFGGNHVVPDSSALILAPKLYRGVLLEYTESMNGEWNLNQFEGRDPGHPTHEVVHYEFGDDFPSIVFSGGIGAEYRSVSHGIGSLNDGRVLHLSSSENEEGIRQLQIEIFDQKRRLTKVSRLEEAPGETTVSLLWIDQMDRLYLVDRREGFPIIRIVKLTE